VLHVISSSLHISTASSRAVIGRRRCAWYRGRVRQSRVSRGRRDKPRRKASWASIGGKERGREADRESEVNQKGCRESKGVDAEGCLFWAVWTLPSSKPSEADGDSIPLASHLPSSRHGSPSSPAHYLSLHPSFLDYSFLFLPARRPRRRTRRTLASAAVAVLWKFWTNSKINIHRRGVERRDGLRRGETAAPFSLAFSASEKMQRLPFRFYSVGREGAPMFARSRHDFLLWSPWENGDIRWSFSFCISNVGNVNYRLQI